MSKKEKEKENINMAGFIAKQPNGLYCRFSNDGVTVLKNF